ncbi:MAG TPA: cytochrome ubiquinol oxidase subunit I [Anaerolineae bacterium]
MNALLLARLQFAITTVYHFFFVPLTLGLSIFVALLETLYLTRKDETYKRMAQFWGKLFLINFAMGVATGIVQEFQFGMNWSEYSRFVGDIFGAPLAIEALLAFFLESTFLGIWIFGWDRLSKGKHLLAIWLVAAGSNISALWILIANSFMQEPVGFALRNGRAEMTDFLALLGNPNVWVQYPHVLFSGIATAGFFVMGISAYRLLRRSGVAIFRQSLQMAVVYALIGAGLVVLNGHTQTQHMVAAQPMKIAAAEALWQSEAPASFSLLTIGNEPQRRDVFAIRIPSVLSILACNNTTCEVKGITNLEAEYTAKYGPGDYAPPIALTYWTFRIMVGLGFLMGLAALAGLYFSLTNRLEKMRWFLSLLPFAIALPYLANSAGWLMAELGRQPWIVFGVMKTADGVSQAVSGGAVLTSLLLFVVLYGALIVADVYLLAKYSRVPVATEQPTGGLAEPVF